MNPLHHDMAMAGLYSLLEILPPEVFARETPAQIAFDVYQRLTAMLEAYDAQVGMRHSRLDPSTN